MSHPKCGSYINNASLISGVAVLKIMFSGQYSNSLEFWTPPVTAAAGRAGTRGRSRSATAVGGARALGAAIALIAVIVSSHLYPALAEDKVSAADPALEKRMANEKAARRACKIEICKAFANPQPDGDPITCTVTKTWLKHEILGRVTGGSYVYGYGHAQCTLDLNLSRAEIAKARAADKATAEFAPHEVNCNVTKKDPAEGEAFTVTVALTPKVTFEEGKATAVEIEPVKTEGSTIASAAVTSAMAADSVSGIVSGALAGEVNAFLFEKCKADGVEIAAR